MVKFRTFFQVLVVGVLCVAGTATFAQAYTTPTYTTSTTTYTTPTYITPTYTTQTYTTPTYTAPTPTYTTPTYTTPNYYPSGSTSSGSCVKLSQNLYSGLSDTTTAGAVSQLQKFLTAQGYFTHSTTGYFGPATAAATQAFQVSQGISATGYIGSLTRAAIQRMSCVTLSPAASPPQVQDLFPVSAHIGDTIRLDGSGFLADNAIYVDNYPLVRVASKDGTKLSFVVPLSFSGTQVKLGKHNVFIQNANGSSETLSFTVTTNAVVQHPTIQNIDTPGILYPGQTATWVVHVAVPTNYTDSSYLSAHWGDENLTSDKYSSGSQSVSGSTVTLTHRYSFAGDYQPSFTLSDSSGRVLGSAILTVSVR